MEPLGGLADWEVTVRFAKALGYEMNYSHPSEIMDEIARLMPTFTNVSFEKIDRDGSIQWPCNDAAPRWHADHAYRRVRPRQGPVLHHRVRAHRKRR